MATINEQILYAIRENNKLLRDFIRTVTEKDAEWVGTIKALEIIGRRNQRVLKPLRQYHLGANGFRMVNKQEYQYNVKALRELRLKMDRGEVSGI